MSALADRHILAQERLRRATEAAVLAAWANLPSYDEDQVPGWLLSVLPLVIGAQRQSASLTAAFLGRALGGQAVAPVMANVTGAALRGGVAPEVVYRRPFVATWSALARETDYADAVRQGADRARSTAAMDVQMAMRQTLADVGERDPRIAGYQRVPDAGACKFCLTVSGQKFRTDQLMPLHNGCGCGVDVITDASDLPPRADLGVNDGDVNAAVAEHGELGPVLVDGEHTFTRL